MRGLNCLLRSLQGDDDLDENFLKHSLTTKERSIYTPLKQNYLKFFLAKYALPPQV